MPSPTLKQIASVVGVDRSTVSLALRNDLRLRPETRARIQEVAAKMGYQRNPAFAQLMAQLRSGQIVHFRANIAVVEFTPAPKGDPQIIFRTIKERAWALGYGVERFYANEMSPERLEKILVSRGIRGLILCSLWRDTEIPKPFRPMLARFVSCVIGVHPSELSMYFVSEDHYFNSLLTIRKLKSAGFTKIGMAMHAGINIETESRFIGGYLAGHHEHKRLKPLPILLLEPKTDKQRFLVWFKRNKPEVIACIQEEILDWLREDGFRVPEDVSLVHFDIASTSGDWAGIRQNLPERGTAAVDSVISQLIHNERGLPAISKGQMMSGQWCPCGTLGKPAAKEQRGNALCLPGGQNA